MLLLQIVFAIISAGGGFGAFICFLVMRNFQACIWALATGITATILLQVHWLKYKNSIGEYYTARALWTLAWLGFAMFALGISGFIYNMILYCTLRPPILPVEHSTILSVVWTFLTFLTGARLFWNGRKYAHFVQIDRTKLIETPSRSEAESVER